MNKERLKYIFIGIILGVFSVILINKILNSQSNHSNIELKPAITKTNNDGQVFPNLDLPLKYFNRDDLHWSTGGNDTNDEITYGSFGGESEYRSYPTAEIKLKDYETNPHIYKRIDYNNATNIVSAIGLDGEFWEGLMKDSQAEYGKIVTTYWPDYLVVNKKEFDVNDVNNDNSNEAILTLTTPGLNHSPHRVDIVRNGEIIFSYSGYQPEIELSKTDNGFYLLWTSGEQLNSGYCCPSGQMRTRFVYENNKFNPIWEQEIVYTKVGKSD